MTVVASPPSATGTELSRRRFLAALGWAASGVTLIGCRLAPILPMLDASSQRDAVAWLQVRADGVVVLRSPVNEYGQGATTGLLQIVGEELGVAPDAIELVLPDTALIAPAHGTFGSLSLTLHARPLAAVAAALRELLRGRVAQAQGLPATRVSDGPGGIGFVLPDGTVIGLAAAAAGEPAIADIDEVPAAVTRSFDGRGPTRCLGADVAPPELRAIVTGAVGYSADVRLPDMAYGAMIPPPVPGAILQSVELAAARAVPGFVAAHVDLAAGAVGVVAADPFRLPAVVAAVQAVWRRPPPFGQAELDAELDVDRHLARGPLEAVLVGDAVGDGPWHVDLKLTTPLAAHAPIEARAGVARWSGGRCEIWVGTQDVFFSRNLFARALGVDAEEVVVHGVRMGGAFGGRGGFEGLEAALLARAARRPVKVQWSRPDDFQRSYHGPPTSHRVRVRLGADGRIAAWWHALASGHVVLNPLNMPAWLEAATGLIADEGTSRGALPAYTLGRRRIEVTDVRLPIATGPWRGLGAAPNAFAIEAAVDAAASHAGADPLTFRLRHLPSGHPLARCLTRVRERSRWRGPGGVGRGRAVAAAVYKDATPVAVVADVELDANGAPRITQVVCAQDSGWVINPDRVRAQIEGNIAWAIGYATKHRLEVVGGRVSADYLSAYPLPTIADMPAMELELVESADRRRPIAGVGEAAVTAATAAIAAAAAQALGVEPGTLPVMRGRT